MVEAWRKADGGGLQAGWWCQSGAVEEVGWVGWRVFNSGNMVQMRMSDVMMLMGVCCHCGDAQLSLVVRRGEKNVQKH